MNLYLVTFVKMQTNMPSTNMVEVAPMRNIEVYVLAEDPNTAENGAFVLVRQLGHTGYVSNIKLLASTEQPFLDQLLVIS